MDKVENQSAIDVDAKSVRLANAIKALRDRDELKRRELDAMLNGMSSVRQYVEANRGELDARRGSADLDRVSARRTG